LDLAGLAGPDLAPALVGDPHLAEGNGAADRARLAPGVGGVETAQDRGLGLAVALLQADAGGEVALDRLRRDRRTGGEREAQ
jgi:hypothetical protein